jgi:endogenous inhibitor of DNA gyrase (YacG/DUF329 family)
MNERSAPALRVVRMAAKCPICGKSGVRDYRPFCSKRCADIDLGRWLKESYRVPTEEAPGDDEGLGDGGPTGRPTGHGR